MLPNNKYMKLKFDKSILQRSTDKFVIHARELSSRGTSFLIVLLGVILQASHTTLLMYNVSAFDSAFLKGVVSLGIGIFISSALAIFTLKHDGKDQRIAKLINTFFYFEVFTNVFYYFDSIVLSKGFDNVDVRQWIYFAVSLAFAYIMPYSIKQFAGIIAADKSVDFGSIDIPPAEDENKIDSNQFDELVEMINEIKKTPSLDNAELNSIIDKKLSELPSVSSNDVDISELVKRELMGIDLSNIDTTIDEKIKLSLSDIINNSEVSKATKQELEGMIVSKFKELGKILDDRYLKKNTQIVMQNNLNTDNNN